MYSGRIALPKIIVPVILSFACGPGLAQNPATAVTVDANANRHSINPNIYGIAYGDSHDVTTLNAPLNRWGGNSTTRYNWQIDAHSAASDYYFETYSDGSGTPAGSAHAYVATTRANSGSEPLFTIPMIDYLANLGPNRTTLEGFSVRKYGAQQATDPYNSDAGNGVSSATGKNITGNNPLDTGVANSASIQQAWVQNFVNTYGLATGSTGIKYYVLDNEPSLWYQTHRDVHPSPATYQEMYDKIVAYATAIRSVDPAAKIVGPEEWSWWAMFFSGLDQANGWSASTSDYKTHNQTYYYPWLLQQLYAYKQRTGTQLIDVLSVHCYNGAPADNDDSLSGQQYRNRETRILWDPTFQDPSWYGDIGINGRVINWIATLKAMVSQYHPGLQIGCTEYNWGDEPNLNGATTQADVLGIYGREGFDLATRWTVAKNTNTNPVSYYPTYLASQIYRNYDGNHATFGETSVSATAPNPDNLSAFASLRQSDGALTVMVINKQQGATPLTLNLANFSAASAQAWQIASAAQTAITHLGSATLAGSAITTTLPSQSITLFVIAARTSASSPGAPATVTYDVDDNGKQDLLVYNPAAPGYQYSLLSAGNGTYSSVAGANVNSGSTIFDQVMQADFNGDGKSDVLFYSTATGALKIGLGDGSGNFTYAPAATISSGYDVIARGDFNGDGKTDLLLYRKSDGAASIALSNGSGGFTFIAQTFSPGFTSVAVADYDGDGISDVIVYNNQTPPYNAYYLRGDGAGHFLAGTGLFFGSGFTVYPADLNADRKSDFILYRPADGTVFVALSNGTGFSYHYLLYSPAFTSFKIGDVNGDGFPDLVLYNAVNANGYLLLGDGAGNFPTVYSLFFGPGMDFVGLRDVNGDGKQDVVLYRTADGTSFTGISTGIGFSYTYNYFGPGRIIAQ